jgi:hypothetical protein
LSKNSISLVGNNCLSNGNHPLFFPNRMVIGGCGLITAATSCSANAFAGCACA